MNLFEFRMFISNVEGFKNLLFLRGGGCFIFCFLLFFCSFFFPNIVVFSVRIFRNLVVGQECFLDVGRLNCCQRDTW